MFVIALIFSHFSSHFNNSFMSPVSFI